MKDYVTPVRDLRAVHDIVRFVIGRPDKKSMPHKDDKGRVKVYRDRERCWKEGRAAFPPHVPIEVYSLVGVGWLTFQSEVKHIEVDLDDPQDGGGLLQRTGGA